MSKDTASEAIAIGRGLRDRTINPADVIRQNREAIARIELGIEVLVNELKVMEFDRNRYRALCQIMEHWIAEHCEGDVPCPAA